MTQHIKNPTQKKGHTLDIVATFNDKPLVSNVEIVEYDDVSDHFLIDFAFTCSPEVRELKQIRYRNLRGIDPEKFSSEIVERWGGLNSDDSFGDNINRYSALMVDMMKEQAPERTKMIKIVPDAPWFDQEY